MLTVVAAGLLPATRSLSGAAAKSLLGLPESGDADTWPDRWRTVCWLVAHLALGSGIGLLTLIVPPFILLLFADPLLALPPELAGIWPYRAFGIGQWWAPLVGLGLIVAGFHLVAVVWRGSPAAGTVRARAVAAAGRGAVRVEPDRLRTA
ncbi:hypothetical protein [Saccharopolyspora hattusasensis]|uniref:hypothetical protein n=1 Tax=Saccharopolyspora hattusasensis TaxID=1128679 RepID=UPI003D992D6F